jgi:hypothetical protein
MRTNSFSLAAVLLLGSLLTTSAHAAEKLKGIYSGSGGISSEVHRTLFIEFGADGTAILQQQWHEKDPQTWHAHWALEKKKVTLTYDPAKDTATPEPLVFTFKRSSLVATSWDATTLGPLGPPELTPFGGKNPQVHSVAGCQSLNTSDPRRDCATWGTNH